MLVESRVMRYACKRAGDGFALRTQWLDLRALTPKLLRCATTRIKIRHYCAPTAYNSSRGPVFAQAAPATVLVSVPSVRDSSEEGGVGRGDVH